MTDRDAALATEVSAQLRRSAVELADRLSIDLTPAASLWLDTQIAAGAQRLVSDGVAEDPDSVARARASLADIMFQARHGAAPDGERGATPEELHAPAPPVEEDDLRSVFGALCPGLWPFC
jgi:hypothetical protein